MAGMARYNPQSDEAVIANIEANKAAATPQRQMYDGNGPVSKAVRQGLKNYQETSTSFLADNAPAAVPVRPDIPWTTPDPAGGVRSNFMAAGADRVSGMLGFHTTPAAAAPAAAAPATVAVAAKPQPAAQVQAPVQSTTTTTQADRAPVDWTKAADNAMKAVGGFGTGGNTYNMDGSTRGTTTTPDQDNASRLAAETAQTSIYKAQAAEQDKDRGFRETAARSKALNDRVVELSKPMKQDLYDTSFLGDAVMSNPSYKNYLAKKGVFDQEVAGRKAELASATGQQVLNDTNQNKLDQDNIAGGFGLQAQELRNKGAADTAAITGGFTVASKELSPEDKALKTAQTKVLNEQPTKTQLATQAAESKKAEITQNQRSKIAEARAKAYAELIAVGDPDAASKADDVGMQVEAGLTGRKYTPGLAGQKKTGWFGLGKPEVKRTAGTLSENSALQTELKKRGLI